MSSTPDNGSSDPLKERLRAALGERLDEDETLSDLTVSEFGEMLRSAGIVKKEELKAHFAGEASASTDEDRHEAYGSGVAEIGEDRDHDRGPSDDEVDEILANLSQTEDPDEYLTGEANGEDSPDEDSFSELSDEELLARSTGKDADDIDTEELQAYKNGNDR